MFAIIGMVVVFAAIIGGFLMEKGHLVFSCSRPSCSSSPAPPRERCWWRIPCASSRPLWAGCWESLKGSPFTKERYLNTLKMMYQFLNKVRKEGLLAVEMDVEKPAGERDLQELSGFSGRPSRAGVRVRHAAHGDHGRRGAVRHGPDDGAGHGSASSRGDAAGGRADHGGGFAAGAGHCGGGAGRGDHDGRAGRAAGGDRQARGCGAGGHVSRHSALLRRGRSAELEHEQAWPTSTTTICTCCGCCCWRF